MRFFLEPYKIAVQRKLLLESKIKHGYNRHTLKDFGAAYGNNYEICNYLIELNNKGYVQLEKILIDKRYVLAEEIKFEGYRIPSPEEARAQNRENTNFYGLGEEVFQKVINEKPLSVDQLQKIFDPDSEYLNHFLEYLSFSMLLDKNGIRKIEKELKEYIEHYIQGEIIANGSHRYMSYQNQQAGFERTIGRLAKVYGAKNLILNASEIWTEIAKPNSDLHRNYLNQTRFLETLLAMEYQNLIEIVDVIRENEVRVTITANEVPSLNTWNRDFHNIADSSSYFEFIKNKAESSKKGLLSDSTEQYAQNNEKQIAAKPVELTQVNSTPDEYNITQTPRKLSKRERKQELKGIIKTKSLGKKEAAFLLALIDLEPMEIKKLATSIQTKDCKHLKGAVEKKLKGTNWSIKTTRGGGFSSSFYQLVQLPS